jgi:MFS family permease
MDTTNEQAATRGALAGLSLAILIASLGTSIANVALPALAESFDASFQAAQWVVLAYLLASTTLLVSVGRLGDLAGRRRLLLAGIATFTAASALCGAAPTLATLVLARAAQGLGAAIMLALAMALVSEAAPKGRAGSAMGLLGTMSAAGTALGPSLGGVLIAAAGWRAIFLVTVPLGILAGALALRHVPAEPRATAVAREAFDARGTVLLAATLAAYTLAMTAGGGRFGALNAALVLAALVAAGLFALAQVRARSPLVRPAMLRSARLRAGLVASGLVSTVVMTTLVVGPFYLTGALGLDAAVVGLVLAIGPVVVAFAGVPAGRLTDGLGARRTTVAGLAGIGAGAIALAALPGLGLAGYVVPIVVLTLGYALFQTANNAGVMGAADPAQRGVVAGMLNLSRNLGLITGASLMGAVFSLAAGTADVTSASPASLASAMRVTFLVAAGLALVALASVLTTRRRTFPSSLQGGSRVAARQPT